MKNKNLPNWGQMGKENKTTFINLKHGTTALCITILTMLLIVVNVESITVSYDNYGKCLCKASKDYMGKYGDKSLPWLYG